MFITKSDQSKCLAKSEPNLNEDVQLVVLPCIEAIGMGDAREIFTVDREGFILAYADGFCVASETDNYIEGT